MTDKCILSTPHLDKLKALLVNDKLPKQDILRVENCILRYEEWQKEMDIAQSSHEEPDKVLTSLVTSLNLYKLYVDIDLIFDSPDDFLYRQKGQLKLDNTVIEEFLPRLIHPSVIPEINGGKYHIGPTTAFSAAYFSSSLQDQKHGGGLSIRSKDQDFAISRKLFLRSSHNADFSDSIDRNTYIAYVVAECKTNLDKTMFQEACATASDVRFAVSGAKYFLLCEWLDMTPLSTAPTDIEEVLILRQGKRISSNIRSKFSTVEGRRAAREDYLAHLKKFPYQFKIFKRLCNHIQKLLTDELLVEKDVLDLGYF